MLYASVHIFNMYTLLHKIRLHRPSFVKNWDSCHAILYHRCAYSLAFYFIQVKVYFCQALTRVLKTFSNWYSLSHLGANASLVLSGYTWLFFLFLFLFSWLIAKGEGFWLFGMIFLFYYYFSHVRAPISGILCFGQALRRGLEKGFFSYYFVHKPRGQCT